MLLSVLQANRAQNVFKTDHKHKTTFFRAEIQEMTLQSLFSSQTFSVLVLLVISSGKIKTVGIHGNVC